MITVESRLLTGGEAVAHALCQIQPDVVPVYPITPQTPIIQTFSSLVADGAAHTEIVNVESEHSAMSAAIGAALAGARTATATSSQGLALMAEVVYIAASMRAPLTMAVGNRALSGPINIHCDHSDSMLIRDSGVVQLFAENAQEAYDLMVMAPRIAEHPASRCRCSCARTGSRSPMPPSPCACSRTRRCARSSASTGRRCGRCSMPATRPRTGRSPCPTTTSSSAVRRPRRSRLPPRSSPTWPTSMSRSPAARTTASSRIASTGRRRSSIALGSTAGTVKDVIDELREDGERSRPLEDPFVPPVPRTGRSTAGRWDASRGRPRPSRLAGRGSATCGGRRVRARRLRRDAAQPRLRAGRARSPPRGDPPGLPRRGAALRRCQRRRAVSRLKTLVEQRHGVDPLRGGHALCQGCGIPMVVRVVLGTITRPTVVVNATGCLEVATTRFPTTAWNVPWVHVAFENAAAVASGIEAAQRALVRRAVAAVGGRRRDCRLRRRRRDVRHRDAGALGRPRARTPLPVRLLRQRGVHEHRRPALRRDAVRGRHDDEPRWARELRQGTEAQGHDGDRRRAPCAVRRAGSVDATGTT